MLVKICGLRTADDVNAAIEAGADAIGFVFADSVRRIEPAEAAAISASVSSSIRRVAVMLHPTNDEWQDVLRVFAPDVLQTDALDFEVLEVPESVERWPVYRQGGSLPAATGPFVYEGPRSGQGETVDWTVAADIARGGKMVLAGGLATANVAAAIATVAPFGVDVSSAVESAPGRKDSRLIHEFVNAARAAERKL